MKIGTAVFTKGQGLGNDDVARHFYGRYGIKNAWELCERFYQLDVSFMLGFHSFDHTIQDRVVRTKGYTKIRDNALENLVSTGFTNANPTRLAFSNAPVRKVAYGDAFPIYVWARERNIYPVTAVLMTSGKQIDVENHISMILIAPRGQARAQSRQPLQMAGFIIGGS